MKIAVIMLPWRLGRRGVGYGAGPAALLHAGLIDQLTALGHQVVGPWSVELTEDEQKQYGAWHKTGLANRHLADLVTQARREGHFPLVLESDCSAALGVLAGLQHAGPEGQALTLGMIWFDAHGDFNTPETTLSGRLGGMPVAIAAGLCLNRLRRQAGLEPPILPQHVVMMAVRDLDPLERELVDQHQVKLILTEAVAQQGERFHSVVARLARAVNAIYVHVDVDVLDPQDLPSAALPVPKGLRTAQLAQVLGTLVAHYQVAALGISALNPERDVDGRSVASTLEVICGAAAGLANNSAR